MPAVRDSVPDDVIVVEFEFGKAEFISAMRTMIWRNVAIRLVVTIAMAFTALGVILVAVGADGFGALVSGLMVVGYTGVVVVALPWRRWRSSPVVRGTFHFEFSGDWIAFSTAESESRVRWSYYRKVVDAQTFYYFIHNRQACNPIPKSAFAPGDEDRFTRLAARHLGSAGPHLERR